MSSCVDGVIAAVGKDLVAPEGVLTIEAGGRWVTPGIIDPHSHLGNFPTPYTGEDLQHTDVNEDSDPNTAQVWAQHSINVQDPGFARALAGGVTTLQVMPGSTNLFGGRTIVLRNVPATTAQGMIFPGAPFGLKMACGENVVHAYGDSGRFPVSRMGAVAGQRAAWMQASKYLHDWERYQRGRSARTRRRNRTSSSIRWRQVLRGSIRVHVHCYRADDIAQMFDMAHEFGFRIAAIHHAVEALQDSRGLRARGSLRGRLARLVGVQARSLRRDPRERGLPAGCRRLRRDALRFRASPVSG